MLKLKIGILISGNGNNMHSIIKACKNPKFPVKVNVVISNRPNAKGINLAKNENINVFIIDHKKYNKRKNFEKDLNKCLINHNVELVCNAGFMRILTKYFVNFWLNRQINIHPSLLPSFKGLHVHKRVLKSGVKITGCSIHYVNSKIDEGPIIAQAAVPVLFNDNINNLSNRVLKAECQLYPYVLKIIAEKKIYLDNNIVKIKNNLFSKSFMYSLYSPNID